MMGFAMESQSSKPQSFADVLQGKDPVTGVNQFCQRHGGKPLAKDDITYTSVHLTTGGHQVTIKLDCLGGLEFAGEICASSKDAKLSAAQQVLDHHADEIAQMPAAAASTKKKKRPAGDGMGGEPKAARMDSFEAAPSSGGIPSVSNKGDLNTTYSKIIRRVINKGEIVYHTGQVVGGFQSQVQLPGLPEPWNKEIWAGEVMQKKQDADQSVAGVALNTLRSDPSLMAAFNAPPKPNNWVMKGGMSRKGMGKGKDYKGNSGVIPPSQQAASQQGFSAAATQDTAVWNQTFAAAMAASGYPQYMTGLGGLS